MATPPPLAPPSFFEVLNGAVVWLSKTSHHSLNILGYESASMTLAQQASTVNFEEKLLACASVPHEHD